MKSKGMKEWVTFTREKKIFREYNFGTMKVKKAITRTRNFTNLRMRKDEGKRL